MAKILIISANLRDWTKNSGGKERTATLAEALSAHEVTFLSFVWGGDSFEKQISESIYQIQPEISAVALKKYRSLIKDVAKVNHDICFEILKEELSSFTKKAKELAAYADLVIVDHMSIAPLVQDLGDVPVVYNSHNAELTMAQQLYPNNSKVIAIVESIEKSIISNSIATTYCSKKDIKELEDIYGKIKKSIYIPNGAVAQDFTDPIERMKSKDIIFVGSGHPPNVEAAKKLIPLAKMMPDYNFVILGSAGNAIKNATYSNNLQVLGHVSDEELHLYFKNSFAFINPMDSGSGTHLKMMKALSYGIPIITSQVGARGFAANEIEESMIIAESLNDIKDAVETLTNKKVYIRLSQQGYAHGKTYDWKKIKKTYSNFINDILNSVPKRSKPKVDNKKKENILVYSIIRNRANNINRFHSQLVKMVKSNPNFNFYLSIYENDSTDQTKQQLFLKDWSFFKGVSIITENIDTEYFESVKSAQRVENLSKARNKAIEAGGFLDKMDYVLMVEGDVMYSNDHAQELLNFKNKEPNFDIVSTISLRKNGKHYDWWATRTSAVYNTDKSEIEPDYESKQYGKYYSTSNGLCLYRAKAFKEGVRHHWINKVTGEFDCEMVVLCQGFHEKGYKNIYILYKAEAHHLG
jgi:glycosyltransferase involved in cell wall biosynthesis